MKRQLNLRKLFVVFTAITIFIACQTQIYHRAQTFEFNIKRMDDEIKNELINATSSLPKLGGNHQISNVRVNKHSGILSFLTMKRSYTVDFYSESISNQNTIENWRHRQTYDIGITGQELKSSHSDCLASRML